MAATWTVRDRLKVASGKDRRAKLLLSLDGAPPLAAHNLRLFAWYSKTPGRAVFANGSGVYACVVAKDLVLADDKQAATLREAAATEAEAAAARLEKELAAGGKPFTAVGSAVCFEAGTLDWVYVPLPPAADTPVASYSAMRRRCQDLDAAFCAPVELTPGLPTPFAFPSPAPTVAGGAGLETPTINGAAATDSATTATSPAADPSAITKRLDAALSEVDSLAADFCSAVPPAAGAAAACAESEPGSPSAVAAAPAPSLTSTSSCEDAAVAPADGAATVPVAAAAPGPLLREKADSFVLELLPAEVPAPCSSISSASAACGQAAAPAPATAATSAAGDSLAPAPAPATAASSSPLVRLRSTERFIVLDFQPTSIGASSSSGVDALAAAGFGSPIREPLRAEAEAARTSSHEAPPGDDGSIVEPCAVEDSLPAQEPVSTASHKGSSNRLLGPWALAALAGMSGVALVAVRWRGH